MKLFPGTDKGGVYQELGGHKMKDRKRQRENRRIKNREELLEKRDLCGVKDLTPYNAVLKMKKGKNASITLK